jgi:succinoglycan biosynthesis protein ExoM
VAVVDDDPAASAEATATAMAGAFELGLRYTCSGSGNISIARNQAIELGSQVGDWLALIDDDCLPEVDWVRELVAVQAATGADCVSGACVDDPPPGAPGWLSEEPFLDELSTGVDGATTDEGYLKNTLVSAAFLREHGIRFDLALGVASGEDAMFVHDLHRAGVDRRFAAKALVHEQVPEARATLGYQLRRRFWYGNTEAVTSIASGNASRARMVAGGLKKSALGAVHPVRRLVAGGSAQWRFGLSEVLRGVGRVLGALGYKVDHR